MQRTEGRLRAVPKMPSTTHPAWRTPGRPTRRPATFRVDSDFKRLIHPLAPSERRELEASLVAAGRARDPLVIWNGILLDGHHRYELCRRHKLPFTTTSVTLANRTAAKAWIIRNQFARRNLQAFARIELALVLEPLLAAEAKTRMLNGIPVTNLSQGRTRSALAAIAGVSEGTFANGKFISEHATNAAKDALRRGEMTIHEVFQDIQTQQRRDSRIRHIKALTASGTTFVVAGGAELRLGDCTEQLRGLPEHSTDSIVTDSPYELGFMNHGWDTSGIAYNVEMWRECLRVLKPGGHLVAFGGTRTSHRMVCAIEDAGFEIVDTIAWIYATGFPKSVNIGKSIDTHAGATRKVVGTSKRGRTSEAGPISDFARYPQSNVLTTPATREAKQWNGWGTALKPAHEPIVLARKPLGGTIVESVLTFGTGGLNIDSCRVGTSGGGTHCNNRGSDGKCRGHQNAGRSTTGATFHGPNTQGGRWATNVVLDEGAAAELDSVSGGASRFFYVAKTSRSEREAGCGRVPRRPGGSNVEGFTEDIKQGKDRNRPVHNHHPTVKPIALMRYLCRLVTPPGGVVLDPFCGSGSTGCAAVLEGFRFVGIESDAEYLHIARARIAHWQKTVAAEKPRTATGVRKESQWR